MKNPSRPIVEICVKHPICCKLRIHSPEKDPSSPDYFCRIDSDGATFRANIFGINCYQAIELALKVALAEATRIATSQVPEEPKGKG
jgi:hypothetical protein